MTDQQQRCGNTSWIRFRLALAAAISFGAVGALAIEYEVSDCKSHDSASNASTVQTGWQNCQSMHATSWTGVAHSGRSRNTPKEPTTVETNHAAQKRLVERATRSTREVRRPAMPTKETQYKHPQWVELVDVNGHHRAVMLCQNYCRLGVECSDCQPCGETGWTAERPIPWEAFSQGEYIGPARLPHVPVYHLRVDDDIEFVYRLTRIESARPYELNVGDSIRVESMIDPSLDREVVILPDGTITLKMIGQVRAARRTVQELRDDLEKRYKAYYKIPEITVTPIKVNTRLEDLRAAVASKFGDTGGQAQLARVTPEGTVQLPGIGSVPAQNLTLNELKQEVDERYARLVDGIDVTPRLARRAPRYIYVVGEVRQPGRFTLEGPTTAIQSIALAGGWNIGGRLRQIVIFRRTADWRLIATRLDLRGALMGERPCPADEIWLRDSDIVVVPKNAMERADNLIELIFTRGIYGVIPMQGVSFTFSGVTAF